VAKKSAGKKTDRLQIDGHEVPVTNLDKVLYPENGFTKAQVLDYYIRVSQYLLPHFQDRPVTLQRFPDGVRGHAFYEKQAPKYTPEWVKTFPVPRRAGGTDIQYILINDLATLVWCANVASLELHPFLHCVPHIERPTSVVFDLDPGEGTDVLTCAEVAFLLKDVLAQFDLEAFAKVSGSKGLQVYVPLNSGVKYGATQRFARSVAELLTKEHPTLTVAEMAKRERANKVFIDWSQNSDFKTTAGVYSLRAKQDRPFVSLPVRWDELEAALKRRSADGLRFEPDAALERLSDVGDLFAQVLTLKQRLPKSLTKSLKVKPKARMNRILQNSQQGEWEGDTPADVDPVKVKTLADARGSVSASVNPELDALPRSSMKFVEPMQCQLVAQLPEGKDWEYELKLDGYRALAIKEQGVVQLLSRRNNSLNTKFGSIAAGLNALEDGIILDGEVVALDGNGRPSFHRLQHLGKNQLLLFYAFDLLAYRGKDLTGLPLKDRRELLVTALQIAGDPIRLSAVLKATAQDLIGAVREQGLEGVIAKRTQSKYEPGERSGRWVKYKVNQGQELVIGGYKPSGKNHFDNLAAGYYDEGRLIFIAKIKNGYTPAVKEEIFERIKQYETKTCPFDNLPEPKNARRGEALTADAMKKYRWLRPEVVAQVEFTDWTSANHLRHSSFVTLRDDKNPLEVVHETASSDD